MHSSGSNWSLATGINCHLLVTGSVEHGCPAVPYRWPLYPRASIMGVYYDLFIDAVTFPNRKMQVDVYGSAPNRQFVISYFEIPYIYCQSVSASHQIVLYESHSLIDVFIANKPFCSSTVVWQYWNTKLGAGPRPLQLRGKTVLNGVSRIQAISFIPSGATSRFVKL